MTTHVDHGAAEASRHGIARSPHWHSIEMAFKKANPHCEGCGSTVNIQVHHRIAFHFVIALGRPDLELDFRNLISLCETEKDVVANNCHLDIGHLQDFKSFNQHVGDDVKLFHKMTAAQLEKNPTWLKRKANKIATLDQLTPEEKKQIIDMMARWPKAA